MTDRFDLLIIGGGILGLATALTVTRHYPRVKLGEGHFNALVGLEELGMDPMEVLKSATSNVAGAYRLDDEIGTLRPGRWADIVILDANPLESARNYRGIHMVIKEGRTVDLEALPVAPIISSMAAVVGTGS